MPHAAPMFRHHGSAQARADYEQRRGSARQRGYTPAWDAAAFAYRASHPLCIGCQAVGRTAACDVVDHIVPHKGNARLFWSTDNWQPACDWHHDTVKQQLERLYAAGKLSAAELRLDSAVAIELTHRLAP